MQQLDPSLPLSDNPVLRHLICPLASSHLSLSPAQLAELTLTELQQRLTAAGVPFDPADLLRSLMDSEAAKWLQTQREAANAELAMVRKLLAGKAGRKLTAKEVDALRAREGQLRSMVDNYDDLLGRLLEEERKRRGLMDEGERIAYERMMEKLRKGKAKGKGIEVDSAAVVGAVPGLVGMLAGVVEMHLGMTAEELARMTVEGVQEALKKAGVDIDIADMLRGLTDSHAATWLHAQRTKAEAEADLLRKLLSGKRKLTARERQDAEARLAELEAEVECYDELLRRLLQEELKRQKVMSDEERLAYERMQDRLRRGKAKESQPPAVNEGTVVGENPLLMDLLTGLASSHLSLSPDALAGMTVAEVQAELAKAGVDIDILAMMRDLTDSEAAKWLQAQRAKAEAEANLLRKLLSGKGRKLTEQERAEAAARLEQVEAEIQSYDDLLRRLLEEELKRQRLLDEEERLAHERMMERLRKGKKKKPAPVDLDPSSLVGANPVLMEMVTALAASHLSLSPDEVAEMSINDLQAAFTKAGVDVDLLGLMRDLTDSQAAKWLQAQRAKAEAEANLLRKLLSGKKKLTGKEREEAEGRLVELEAEIAGYDDLLRRLLEEELRRQRMMEEEERLAHERMMEKLRKGKSRKQQQQTVGPVTVDTVIGDNSLLMDMLAGLARSHLSLSPEQLSTMTVDELQTAFNRAGVDIDIMGMLRDLTDSHAATWLHAQRTKAEAEADLLRKLLSGKRKLTARERQDAEARLAELEAEVECYDELLRRLLQEELKRQKVMSDEERLAYERMQDRLRRGKAKKAPLASTAPSFDLIQRRERVRLDLDRVFDLLTLPRAYTCERCSAANAVSAVVCSSCGHPAPPTPSAVVNPQVLLRYHRLTHGCDAGADLLNALRPALGACTRSTFFDWVEAMTSVCTRSRDVWWDCAAVSEGGMMEKRDAVSVWLMNGGQPETWGAGTSSGESERQWLGVSDVHELFMTAPDVLDDLI